jgi:hypothetical protein
MQSETRQECRVKRVTTDKADFNSRTQNQKIHFIAKLCTMFFYLKQHRYRREEFCLLGERRGKNALGLSSMHLAIAVLMLECDTSTSWSSFLVFMYFFRSKRTILRDPAMRPCTEATPQRHHTAPRGLGLRWPECTPQPHGTPHDVVQHRRGAPARDPG